MSRANGSTSGITGIAGIIGVVAGIALAACGGNKKDVEAAKHSLYDADFAIVYSAALDVTRDLYPNMDESPGHGMVRTSWHQVQYANQGDDLVNPMSVNTSGQQLGGTAGATAAATAGGMPGRGPVGKRYFIRFDVTVAGGRPWHVKVVGHASEWEPGAAMPVELHGIARPPWLEGRTEALIIAIHKRVKAYAVPMKDELMVADTEVPRTDPAAFKNVPPEAAKRLASLQDALSHRDNTALRQLLADDVRWSLGADPGADIALATWQADPNTLDLMEHLVTGGCVAEGDRRVLCPAGDPVKNQYQLALELRGDSWKVTSFIKAE